ncbi:glyoxalase/bleomycin resistance/extradiol dioxygenase family protein [Micromonospora terminaliae]|uniref:Glyoxalase/bleomycin resistance/extradiol dioxygenase family protein n=1 Tax=Micromonospora terminaliae TaxID=1914461 RepID=A0AAJ3DMJ1_9ACTN|nr:VOC family protein [Micromonospora terminaliae]NES31982.1 glyoxalase/bleomycin resistance/extradiol dioxygenase family protein [Micromonospora terminaliae]QGL47667.1 glyoxalase/bleomycin resistance/extradiol dioxygenase family protein [Micromonospora terminaliae]
MSAATFVNLPVADLDRAVEFFTALGFTAGPRQAGAGSAQLSLGDTVNLILHDAAAFAAFAGAEVCDTATSREVIVGLAVDRRERVDALVDVAVRAGGTALGPGQDLGFMYMRGFRDLDGHQWSFLHLAG